MWSWLGTYLYPSRVFEIVFGFILFSLSWYLLYHVARYESRIPGENYRDFLRSSTVYVSILARSKITETISCSRLCPSIDSASGTAQLTFSVVLPRHDLFVILVTLKYTHRCALIFLLFDFMSVKCLLMSGKRRIIISSALLAI